MKFSNFLGVLVAVFFPLGGYSQVVLEGLASGRYERKASPSKESSSKNNTRRAIANEEEAVAKPIVVAPVAAAKNEQTVTPVEKADSTKAVVMPVEAQPLEEKSKEVTLSPKESVDKSENKLALEVGLVMMDEVSESKYSFRDYRLSGHGASLRAGVQLSSVIGINGGILLSTPARIDEVGSASSLGVRREIMDLGFSFGQNFEDARTSVTFDLGYLDDQVIVPSSSLTRAKVGSSGVGIGFSSRIAWGSKSTLVTSAKFYPFLNVKESSDNAVLSGDFDQASRVVIKLSGEYLLNTQNTLFWSLSYSHQQEMYSGATQGADPVLGTLNDVSVESKAYLFSLGYRWGK